jgi:molybdopterin molybdotransferase
METEKNISLEAAQNLIAEVATPLATEVVPIEEGYGRVVAQDVKSCRDEPPLPQAAMDGYAVCSADVESVSGESGVILSVVGTVTAGRQGRFEVKPGQAVRIMTGACMPGGADAVVPQEMTRVISQSIRVLAQVATGENVTPVGNDFRRDQHLIPDGAFMRATEVTVLAALGYPTVTVRRQPRVAVLATGDELVEVGKRLEPEGVFASNLYTLKLLVNNCGATATSLGIATDSLDALTGGLLRGMKRDVVVTTGGTGKGKKDLMAPALAALGGEVLFQGVAMMPGKQALLARLDKTLLFALPGRPAAVRIAFEQLVRPALLGMQAISQVKLPEITARLSNSIRSKSKVLSFHLCRVNLGTDGPQVRVLRSEKKGIFTEMLAANGVLKVAPGQNRLEAGESVRVQLLDLGLAGLSYFSAGQSIR